MSMGRALPRFVLAALLLTAITAVILIRPAIDVAAIEQAVAQLGALGPLVFVALYVAATVLFLPGSLLGLTGGALFGPVLGVACTLAGATFGATLAFLAARYVASDWVACRAGKRLKQIIQGVEAEGWRFVLFVRLVPLIPFNLLNYALGLTRIRLAEFAAASLVGMAPGTIAYTYLGYAGREALAGREGIVRNVLVAVALLACAAFLPRLVRRLRSMPAFAEADLVWIEARDLANRLNGVDRPFVVDVRGPDEFEGELGHIDGALNIPFGQLPDRATELERFKRSDMVLVCKTQVRSAKAAAMLSQAGFSHVAVLRGGMEEWKQLRQPSDDRLGAHP